MREIAKNLTVFTAGGLAYGLVEIAWRSSTHISMFFVGGICFWLIGSIDEHGSVPSLIYQSVLSCLIVTSVEFTSGVFINIVLGLGVWDYSALPFNVLGQVCLPFSALWLLLSVPAIYFEDFLRAKLFGEKMKQIDLFSGRESRPRARIVREKSCISRKTML